MNVPFLDLALTHAARAAALRAAFNRVLASGQFVLGPEVAAFETEWASACGVPHAVGMSNGLDALTLALRAANIGPGDEVLVPAHTFIATWLAVSHVGAKPVPVEPDPLTYTIDPARLAAAVTPATRAVVPVHLYGHPADMDAVHAVAAAHGLTVIADAAQAHGARYRGAPLGGTAAWSFYPAKNFGALGDAGAVTTDDPILAERLRSLRNYGSTTKYRNDEPGWNARLDELQAALLRALLPTLAAGNARRAAIAARYTAELTGCGLTLPHTAPWAEHAWHLYVVRHPDRDAFATRLTAAGIETLIHYPIPPHRQRAYAGLPTPPLPLAEQLVAEVLSLPIGPHMPDAHVDAVIAAVRAAA